MQRKCFGWNDDTKETQINVSSQNENIVKFTRIGFFFFRFYLASDSYLLMSSTKTENPFLSVLCARFGLNVKFNTWHTHTHHGEQLFLRKTRHKKANAIASTTTNFSSIYGSNFGFLFPRRGSQTFKRRKRTLTYLGGHMNKFDYSSRHHEIIVCMIFSTLVDEHHVRQGDIHESENKSREEERKDRQLHEIGVDSLEETLTRQHLRFVQPPMFRSSNQSLYSFSAKGTEHMPNYWICDAFRFSTADYPFVISVSTIFPENLHATQMSMKRKIHRFA